MKNTKSYTIHSFTQHHDYHFIEYAYLHILKRLPDEAGEKRYLHLLREGSTTKIQILCMLQASKEAEQHQVLIEGIKKYCLFYKFLKIPVFGQILHFFTTLIRIPYYIQQMKQIEANNSRLLYTLEQIESNFKWTSKSLEVLAEQIDTKASDEDIKILHRILLEKIIDEKNKDKDN